MIGNKQNLKKKVLYGALAFGLATGGAGFVYYKHAVNQSLDKAGVYVKNLTPDTKISYEVVSNGKVIDQGHGATDSAGALRIGSAAAISGKEKLTYKIDLEKARLDKAFDTSPSRILVDVDNIAKSVEFSGQNFDASSKFLISDGKDTLSGVTDWAGNFKQTNGANDKLLGQANGMVQLALQNVNIGRDVDELNPNAAVEVLFGDSSGATAADVDSRYGASIVEMTRQLSTVIMYQALVIGAFFDAKAQLETQRKIQELQAKAHKDYHPSEQMCRFGTFMRSIATAEAKSENDKRVVSRYLMDQYLGVQNSSSAGGLTTSSKARMNKFITTYCDPNDRGGGLLMLCDTLVNATKPQRERFNKDIDFTRTLDSKLTVDVNFGDTAKTDEEEDVLALAANLYFQQVFDTIKHEHVNVNPGSSTATSNEFIKYDPRGHYNSRSFAAKMAVAHNSFASIVGMKSAAPAGVATPAPPPAPVWPVNSPRVNLQQPIATVPTPPFGIPWTPPVPPVGAFSSYYGPAVPNLTEDSGWNYMKAMLRELGITDRNASGSTDDEINAFMGLRPSYYAQMEVLTKKIYQSPEFYSSLYDKPANVDRIGAAIDAIALMNLRDRYQSTLRREMITAVMVEEKLAPEIEDVNTRIFSAMQEIQTRTQP